MREMLAAHLRWSARLAGVLLTHPWVLDALFGPEDKYVEDPRYPMPGPPR